MRTLRQLILSILALVLMACSPVTQTNFDKIKPGMSRAEVVKILGEPTESISLGLGEISGTTSTWKGNDARIVIQFFNDQVALKNYYHGIEKRIEEREANH